MPGCWKSSPTSRPRAAPFSNGSRARPCPASQPWNRADGEDHLTAAPLAVLVHDRVEAETALILAGDLGVGVELVMAAGILGPAAVKALEELLGRPIIVLCDDRTGLALEALRVGLRQLVLESGQQDAEMAAASRLADIAQQFGGELRLEPPVPLHALSPDGRRFEPLAHPAALGPLPPDVP